MEYTYDELGRIAKQKVTVDGHASETNYTYLAGTQTYTPENANDNKPAYATTGLIERITHPCGDFIYDYDANGNITRVVQDNVATVYSYDALGQLIRVVDGQEGATWEYTYDQGGNITSKKKFVNDVLTESMVFDYVHEGTSLDEEQERENKWRDLLKYVNGKRIYYDMIGNPLQVGENNDADKVTYTWEKGRQLASMSKPGTTASFKYNENGLRIQKTVNGVVTDYTLHGKNVVHMTQGSNELHFFYDASNKPAVVVYNGVPYSYVKNLQGDVVAILDSNGAVVVQYKYDAWGRPISKTGTLAATLGTVQPFRYRGYVYDEETGLYYLRSRYYCNELCRFISTDTVIGASEVIFDLALYTYAANRPINSSDSNGQCCETAFSTVLSGNSFGSHELIQGTMCSCEFIHYLRQMVDRKWRYPKKGSDWSMKYLRKEGVGEVDCVGVYRYIMKWYYTQASYYSMLGYGKGRSVNNVWALYTYGTQYTGELNETTLEWEVWPGMALFEYNDSYKGIERWRHVAYYIGITEEYGHTVIESYDWGKTMRMASVDLSRYNYYGQLEGIHVCSCNAVEIIPID